jgi:hypothetical protein
MQRPADELATDGLVCVGLSEADIRTTIESCGD